MFGRTITLPQLPFLRGKKINVQRHVHSPGQGKYNILWKSEQKKQRAETCRDSAQSQHEQLPQHPTKPKPPVPSPLQGPCATLQHPQCEVLGKEVPIRELTPILDTTAVSGVTQDNKTTACEQHSASVCFLCCPNKSSPI